MFGANLFPDPVVPTWDWAYLGADLLLFFLPFPPRTWFEWKQEFGKVGLSGKFFRAKIRDFLRVLYLTV